MDSVTFSDFTKLVGDALNDPLGFSFIIGGVICIGLLLNQWNERRKSMRAREEYERIYPPERKYRGDDE